MVVVMVFLGSFAGLLACVGAMVTGQPLWLALALYPLVGTATALLLGAITALRPAPQPRAAVADARGWRPALPGPGPIHGPAHRPGASVAAGSVFAVGRDRPQRRGAREPAVR